MMFSNKSRPPTVLTVFGADLFNKRMEAVTPTIFAVNPKRKKVRHNHIDIRFSIVISSNDPYSA